MSNGGTTTNSNQTPDVTKVSTELESEKNDRQKEFIEELYKQLKQTQNENEALKCLMETHQQQFQKERDSWISREKELLSMELGSDKSLPEISTMEEELRNARKELLNAQEKIMSLESSSNAMSVSKERRQAKSQSEKNPPHPPTSPNEEGLRKENEKLRTALTTAVARLKDKTIQAMSMEKQNVQLKAQVVSLKEVTGITKELLGIRNTEVESLRSEMETIQAKIQAEKDQRLLALERVEKATRLNADLKREYEIQLSTFKKLKSKYQEKVDLLSSENRRLVAEANAEGRPGVVLDVGPVAADDEESPQH